MKLALWRDVVDTILDVVLFTVALFQTWQENYPAATVTLLFIIALKKFSEQRKIQ